MRKLALILLLLVTLPAVSQARDEAFWQRRYCDGMELEKHLPSGGYVDCVSDEFAIEVEWAQHWAESVGQSLYYAAATNRKPGIVLLCESSEGPVEGLCRSYVYRLEFALKFVSAHVDVWTCAIDKDLKLDDCFRPQIQSVSEQPSQQNPELSAKESEALTSTWKSQWLPAIILVMFTLLASLVLFVIYLRQRPNDVRSHRDRIDDESQSPPLDN